MIKKFLFIFIITISICGCTKTKKDVSHYFKYIGDNYEIHSYKSIQDNEKDIIAEAYAFVMEYLGQEELKDKFIIKLFYNQSAFDTYCNHTGDKKNTISAACFYKRRPVEIAIPSMYLLRSVVGHEITHAVQAINNMVFSDGESIPSMITDKLRQIDFDEHLS